VILGDFVFMLTDYDKIFVKDGYKIRGNRISTISNGSDTKIIRNDKKEGLEVRRKLGI